MAEEGSDYQRILEENVELRKALEQLKDRHLKMKGKGVTDSQLRRMILKSSTLI